MLGFSDRQGGCHGTQVATGETELLADEVMADGLTLRGNTCWLVRTSVNVVVEGFWSQFQAQLARTLWLICNVCPGCGRSIVTLVLLTATGVSRAESGPLKREYPGSYQLQPGKGFSLPRPVSAPPPRSRLPCSSPHSLSWAAHLTTRILLSHCSSQYFAIHKIHRQYYPLDVGDGDSS